MTSTPPATRRRRDRKAQLAEVAADLFRRHGYHSVGIGDIAAAAGITGPAVYRHFTSKQEILGQVLLSGVDCLATTVDDILDRPGSPAARIPALTEAFARLAIERRDAVALWRWLGRHLDPEQAAEVRRRGENALRKWATALRAARPALTVEEADLLCRATMGVFGSAANYSVTLGKARHSGLLAELAGAVLECDLPRSVDPQPALEATAQGATARGATAQQTGQEAALEATAPPAAARDGALTGSRREVLLAEATRLFRERGYRSVTMEEIGAAAGIAGPSVYRHFGSKAELIRAAGARMADRLVRGAAQAVAGATAPAHAVDRLVDSYVETLLAHRDLMAVYVAELSNLPEEQRGELRRLQRGYVAEWVRLIAAASPGLSAAEARVVAQAAFTVANDLARSGRLASRPGLRSEIAALMRVVVRRCQDQEEKSIRPKPRFLW